MKVSFIFVSAYLAMSATTCWAQDSFIGGNDLYNWCINEPIEAHRYVIGVSDTEAYITEGKPQIICIPETVSSIQLRDTACLYLQNNPANRHYAAASSVLASLVKAFPCS